MSELVEKLSLDILNRAEEKKQLEAQISALTVTLGIAVGALERALNDVDCLMTEGLVHNEQRAKLKDIAQELDAALSPTKETLNQFIEGVETNGARNALESLKKVFSKSGNSSFSKDHVLKEIRMAIDSQVSSNTEGAGV